MEEISIKMQKALKINRLTEPIAVWTGLEPATPCVTGRYSNQLNYQTKFPTLGILTTVSFTEIVSAFLQKRGQI